MPKKSQPIHPIIYYMICNECVMCMKKVRFIEIKNLRPVKLSATLPRENFIVKGRTKKNKIH